ncbi:transposase [Paraburkholderia phosphatilytica]|uniref:transposase n=1 Tax=Paraburkholderia phosphatilytica TaxID=2282883 RepID=UPI000E500BD7|nr:transposase [Paraburkholderia phosphatilytica]
MTPYRDVTDEEWHRIAAMLPELKPRTELRGRPLANTRAVLNGVLWVMYSGATWSAMPRKYPSYQTCHRRFNAWHETGVMERVLVELYGESSRVLFGTMEQRMRSHQAAQADETQLVVAEAAAASPHKPQASEREPEETVAFTLADVFKRAA